METTPPAIAGDAGQPSSEAATTPLPKRDGLTAAMTPDASPAPAPAALPGAGAGLFDDPILRDALGPTADPTRSNPAASAAPPAAQAPVPQAAPRDPAVIVEERTARGARLNERERPIGQPQGRKSRPDPDEAPGIPLGTFVLRPEITQGIGLETRRYGAVKTSRTYLQTTLRGTLTSDWSRHALTVTGTGVLQDNLAGTGATQPEADIAADLRLDLAARTTGHLTAGYTVFREDTTDPNALANATSQSTVQTLTGGMALERQLGVLRGSVSAQTIRTTYGAATLSDGTRVSQSDRNATAGLFKARIGYELSPALVPFLQAVYERTGYDQASDTAGYRRSSDSYTAEAGIAADFGEKLSGEMAAGYTLRSFEDRRLADINGLAVDGALKWSPHRGTDLALSLATALENSTTPGQSGPIAYAFGADLTQQVRNDVVARLGAGYLRRVYVADAGVPDEIVYSARAGLTWRLTRYLGIDADLAYETSRQRGSPDQTVTTASVGLTVRR